MPDPIDQSRTVDAPHNQHSSVASERDETAGSPPPGGRPAPKFGPPAADGEVGTLGPYRVLKQLGAGGMGAVYLAHDARLDRKLALKVMLPEFAADTAAKERFLREACAAAKISHDNVVIVHEADERDGVPYIAMQLLQGYPLDEYLKKKGTPALHHLIRIAREAALGLEAAHKLGLVHRDIKPANLWLEAPNGRVKVLDFGLAKSVGSDAELTRSGAVLGTPAYMSPEQARGEKVDHRTDLFSLGAVLYRLTTGKNPFGGPTVMAVLMALGTSEPTPVRELNPNVPDALAALIHQLLAKGPEDRPQTAAEVAKRLRGILEQLVAPVPSSPETAGATPPAADVSQSQPVVLHPLPVQPPSFVPMQVTAQPGNAFADLGADEATDEPIEAEPAIEEPTHPRKRAERKKPGGRKGVWVAAGVAALFAVVAAGVIVIKITNRDGTVTKIEVADDAKIAIDGKVIAKGEPKKEEMKKEVAKQVEPPKPKEPGPIDFAKERKVAEYYLKLGKGTFWLRSRDHQDMGVLKEPLPKEDL